MTNWRFVRFFPFWVMAALFFSRMGAVAEPSNYVADVRFAVGEIEIQCASLIERIPLREQEENLRQDHLECGGGVGDRAGECRS